jgi:hypothetical protein
MSTAIAAEERDMQTVFRFMPIMTCVALLIATTLSLSIIGPPRFRRPFGMFGHHRTFQVPSYQSTEGESSMNANTAVSRQQHAVAARGEIAPIEILQTREF